MPDVHDPEKYLAGAISILAEYPQAVMDRISDPSTGTKVLGDFPTLVQIRKACDLLFEPFEREAERVRSRRAALPVPARKPRTPEEQWQVEQAVERFRMSVGIPPGGVNAFPTERARGEAVRIGMSSGPQQSSGIYAPIAPWPPGKYRVAASLAAFVERCRVQTP
jgi:hypothetical protein